MATPSAKRKRISSPTFGSPAHDDIISSVRDAQSVSFPWDEAVPPTIKTWFIALGKSHNCPPEFLLVGALVSTAAIMGPNTSIEIRKTYTEPLNLYVICIGVPGAGKSQCHRMVAVDPILELPQPLSSMLVDDYTKAGLLRHLQRHEGRALIAHEEMGAFFDLVQKRQFEGQGERQMYCRLYDAGRWSRHTASGSQKQDGAQECSDHNCVCILGYMQPHPFIAKTLPILRETDDGFFDRLLVCCPKTKVLKEEELDDWCTTLQQQQIQSLTEPFRLVNKWHASDEEVTYKFSDEGAKVYREFANEMADVLNEQWESGNLQGSNRSKDKRTLIRLSGAIHVLYAAIDRCLRSGEQTQPNTTPPRSGIDSRSPSPTQPSNSAIDTEELTTEISNQEVKMAVALTDYFHEQRIAFEQLVNLPVSRESPAAEQALAHSILLAKGAFCTPRSICRSVTTRKKPTSDEVAQEMKKLANGGLGKYVATRDKVFYKPLPIEANKDAIKNIVDFETYKNSFAQPENLPPTHFSSAQYDRLLTNAPDSSKLREEYNFSFSGSSGD